MKIARALQLGFIAFARYLHAAEITVQADKPGVSISPDLFGISFEELNYAAAGGLYAELVQNRSFERRDHFTIKPPQRSLT